MPHDILAKIKAAATSNQAWRAVVSPGQGLHLAIMAEPFLSFMLEGKKTVESRFSKHRITPYNSIHPGDLVLLKATGGPVIGAFKAGNVQFVELTDQKLRDIRDQYGKEICADETFWPLQKEKRYATLIEVCDVTKLPPVRIVKKNRLSWVKLS